MATKKVRRKLPAKQTNSLLIQMMNDMNSKLHQIHKDVQKNKQDITRLQNEISFGKGGVKVFVWIIGLVVTIAGSLTFWKS